MFPTDFVFKCTALHLAVSNYVCLCSSHQPIQFISVFCPFCDLPSVPSFLSSSWHLQILSVKVCLSLISSLLVSMGFSCFHLRIWYLINLVDQELVSSFYFHQVGTFLFKLKEFPSFIALPIGHKRKTNKTNKQTKQRQQKTLNFSKPMKEKKLVATPIPVPTL